MTRALIVIDMQRGFDDLEFWGPTANPDCEANVAALIAAWAVSGDPVVVVRHDSVSPASPLHPDADGGRVSRNPLDLCRVVRSKHGVFCLRTGVRPWTTTTAI